VNQEPISCAPFKCKAVVIESQMNAELELNIKLRNEFLVKGHDFMITGFMKL